MFRRRLSAFTTVELLVVLGVIAMLMALLLPALLRVRTAALRTKSISNMRQINLWMNLYSEDHTGLILPSQFNYEADPYPGLVRTIPESQSGMTLAMGEEHQGTWTDILWTENELGLASELVAAQEGLGGFNHSYTYDSPDQLLYRKLDGGFENVLRSCQVNVENTPTDEPLIEHLPRPFGDGAQDKGYPGYFAANDAFNARADNACALVPDACTWINNAQLRVPDRMMYLIDSMAGEIIEPSPYAFQVESDCDPSGLTPGPEAKEIITEEITSEVDFRYSGACLIMLMDGHIEPIGPFASLADLQHTHRVNVTNPFSSTVP